MGRSLPRVAIASWALFGVVVAFLEPTARLALERAFGLKRQPRPVYVVLAPLYAMSLVGDSARRMLGAWSMIAAIVVMIVLVRQLPPTARAIVDAAVSASLAWGILEICARYMLRLPRELHASTFDTGHGRATPAWGGALPRRASRGE